MPKRISRKLLVGLGSIVTFGAVGTISGFGLKSIIDSTLNNSNLNKLNINTSSSGTLTDIPNYNVATEDMFIKTQNLKRFHFGNTQIGQKITPWGWLGVFDDPNGIKSRIALTAWNGEIIWVNEDYRDKDHNVYDMQYDFNSNLLFVLRTDSANGIYNGNNQYPKVWLEVLDATTGQKYKDDVKNDQFAILQQKAMDKLDDVLLLNFDTNNDLRAKTKNLYYLDVTYSHQKKAILATWMPNYMQMARQTYQNDQEGSLPSFWDVINTWDEAATSFMFNTTKLTNAETYTRKERKFQLLQSNGIEPIKTTQGEITDALIEEGQVENPTTVRASDIFLLTNPFFTTSHNDDAFVMHLIGATYQGKVYHKTIGWKIDLSDNAKTEGEIYWLTQGNENLLDRRRYDNIEYWTGGGGYFELKTDASKSWTKAKGWHKNFINANLRANKNMFDENSIVFAYPYSSSSQFASQGQAMPVFNVSQIWIDKNNAQLRKTKGTTQKDNFNFNFGKQINDYYDANHAQYDTNMRLNNIQAYPQPNSVEDNFNHSYNRLISVSPFDNTIIYAAKPNLRIDIFDAGVQNRDKWAGFWIANSWAWQWNKWYRYYHPLVVANDAWIPLASDRYNADEMDYMLSNINDLYTEGFTFDIRSMIDSDWRTSLNLYFNQTGNGKNDSYNPNQGFESSKIGLLKDVLYQTRSNDPNHPDGVAWVNSVTGLYAWAYDDTARKFLTTTINKDSFSSIIHSRADLKKWYPRTWANANFPSNMLRAEEIFSINNPSSFAVATRFDTKLSGPEFNGKESIDLVTAWKDKNENAWKYNERFSRLIMKRPKIQTGLTSEENGLGLVTKYELPPDVYWQVVNKQGWEIRNNDSHLTLTKVDTVENTSKQILSAWSDSYKMKKIGQTTGSLDQNNTAWKEEIQVTNKLDKKDFPNNPDKINLGRGNNNNISRNGTQALRLMLRIVKPSGNLPDWFANLSEDFFNRSYPLEQAFSGETTFKDVVKEFANQKAQFINLSDSKNNNTAVGLGNLKIDAYLELNPKFGNYTSVQDKIYDVTGGKIIIDKNQKNQLIIYKDGTFPRTIYDQSIINYADFNQGGFGTSTSDSWTAQSELNGLKNIKVTTDYSHLTDTLVRKQNDNNPLLTFDFKQGTTDELEVEPTDRSWFENHFKNYNRLLGLFVKFEYQVNNNTQWTELVHNGNNNIWTDKEISDNLAANQNKLLLSGVPKDIKKLRFKLVQNPNNNDLNSTIDAVSFNATDNKYISDEFLISIERITVDKSWITNVTLSNATSSLADIQTADITTFETNVLNNIVNITERNEVKLLYSFDNSGFTLDAVTLVQKIKEKFNNFSDPNQGVFGLWDGANGSQLIKAKFALKNAGGTFKLVTTSNQNPSDDEISNYVKSNIKSKIDMQTYINELESNPIRATMGNTPGTIQNGSIIIPGKSGSLGSGRFNGKTFEEINNILKSEGISIKFKQKAATGGNWSTWLELNAVNTYATNKPEIQIGFVFENNKINNLELVSGSTVIANESVYTLKLNLPKIVKLPTNEQDIINAYNSKPIYGNTLNLNSDETKLNQVHTSVLTILKNSSGNLNDYAGLDAVLEFKYKLGNSTFSEMGALKTYLQSQTNDQSSNSLKLKVNIKAIPGQDAEFALEESLADKEFELLPNDNTIIKKWLHGKNFENELNQNNITVTGSKSALVYNLGTELRKFDKSSGKYNDQQLILQYQLLDGNDNEVQGWTNGFLPSEVKSNVEKIKLRVSSDVSIQEANRIYVYGPEQNNNQAIATIDLSQIATLIKINPNWFDEIEITTKRVDSQNLTTQMLQSWEDKIYAKIPEITTNPTLKNKLVIKYQFIRHENLISSTLLNAINNIELRNYNSTQHHGIVKLYDKNIGDQSGFKIKATFEKSNSSDSTIQFIDNMGVSIDGDINKDARTGVVNTTNITTTINLTEWINHLINTLTVVATTNAGTIPPNGLIPPVLSGDPKTKLFANKTFKEIETWLKAAQVKFWWTKDESGQRDWKDGTAAITQYDPTKKKLWFALDNQSTNLVLTLGNQFPNLDANNPNNKSTPITIRLDAPATIDIDPNKLMVIRPFISGNTKNLTVETEQITKEIEKIKQALGVGFENAPLTIMIQVGNEQEYDYKNVADRLSELQDDVENGIVVARFEIDTSKVDANKFQLTDRSKANQQIINDDGTIKVYINEKNILNDLKSTIAKGTSKALQLEWQNGISINDQNGVLSANNRGKGLKIEYTFKTTLQGGESDPTGADVNEQWVSAQPKTFRAGIDNNLFIRIRLIDSSKYIYDNINKKITIDLTQLKSIINLNVGWLNQSIVDNSIDVTNFGLTQIENYENKVLNVITIPPNLKDKIQIEYDFNNQQNVNKNKLNELISSYKNNNLTNNNLGILQFANGTETNNNGSLSEKIIAKFALKKGSENLYELEFTGGQNQQQLDTSKIITTIDFSKVLTWLQSLKVPFENKQVQIPEVNASNETYFNNQTWSKVESTLKGFGVIIQYRKMMDNNPATESQWSDQISSINEYNDAIGKFQIRFKTDGTKSKNIKFKTTDNETINGATADTKSNAYDVQLKIKLMVQIDTNILNNEFISKPNAVQGDTKNLEINSQLEQKMIEKIKEQNVANNSEFNSLNLQVEYRLGNAQSGTDWKTRAEFIQYLKDQNSDQSTNEISFRFAITQAQNEQFGVAQDVHTLSAHKDATAADIKIKYYINGTTWETKAEGVIISGTSDHLQWNLNTVFGNNLQEKTDGKVYLNTNAGEAIQIYFTTSPGADYNIPTTSDDENEIGSKWVSKKPAAISAATTNLKIKLVAANNTGYVYGPAAENPITAKAHNVEIKVQKVLYVDKEWFKPELVKSEIEISALNKQTHFDPWEAEVYKKLKDKNKVDETIARKIKIKYIVEGNSKNKLDAQDLLLHIQSLRNEFGSANLGIVKLWNNTDQKGIKIDAIFESADQGYMIKVDQNSTNAPTEDQIKNQLNTDKVYTSISLVEYLTFLQSPDHKTNVEQDPNNLKPGIITGFNPPNMSGNLGQGFLYGKSYNEIATRLKELGIDIVFSKDPQTNVWAEKDQIKAYDVQKNALFMAFEIKSQNIKIQLTATDTIGTGESSKDKSAKLLLNVKKYILIDNSKPFWTNIKQDFNFRGHTKKLEFEQSKIDEFLTNIKEDNFNSSAGDNSYKNAPLEIHFQVGGLAFTNITELNNYLAQQRQDLTSRDVQFKFAITQANQNEWAVANATTGTNDEYTLLADNDQDNQIKIFINDNGFEAEGKALKLSGSTEKFEVVGKDQWLAKKPRGLEIWWSSESSPADDSDTGWSQTLPAKLNSANPVLWFHFKISDQSRYVYENAIKDAQGNFTQYSQKQKLDISELKIILKVQKQWLEKIEITGDFKTPEINEDKVKEQINQSSILPNDKPNLIHLEYRIKGTNDWFKKDQFIAKLKELNGSKDDKNFILKREELEVRFATDPQETQYGLEIDNEIITNDNRDKFNVLMIDDGANRNQSFTGVINVDLLKYFSVDNFKIQGSTSKPELIITNKDAMDTLFMPYQSDGLFDVLYSTDYNETTQSWTWNNNQSILANGRFINPEDLWQKLHVTISSKKKFAIKFVSKNNKYNVYQNNSKQADGYVLDLSQNVKITVEINNPFTQAGKTLGIWTRENNTGKYYQGQGGFKIVVADKTSLDVDSTSTIQSAQEFLNSATSINQNEKEVLEFVFHSFGSNASESEMKRVQDAITNYDDSTTWRSFEEIKNQNDDWSTEQGYKVGDYVAVAIRVKKQYATQENPFVLKDNDHSMILPTMQDQNGNIKKPGRISGYKVNTDEINLDNESVTLLSMINPELPPLDGWTLLSKLNLKQDQKGNHLGVDLDLQFYNDFYKNSSGEILISGSGAKLVKRVTSGADIEESGTYKYANGTDITDKDGKPVKIYKNKKTNRLSDPEKSTTATQTKRLDNLGQGSFRLFVTDEREKGLLSLFKNQDVDLKLVAAQGESTNTNLPDFYLDKEKNIPLRNIINPKIKYPIENEKRISYGWNYDDFAADKIQYKDPKNEANKRPEEGFAQIATIFKLIKKEGDTKPVEINGSSIEDAVQKIQKQLDDDFSKQLKFQIERYDSKGNVTTHDGNNIYQFTNLKNKDRIVLKIVAVAEDLYYVNQERPLIINVDGLTQASPDQSTLQHLRVKQNGVIDGQGSFKVLVSNPDNANEDDRQILKGWKFMIRVWDTKKEVKINWTDDPGLVKGLTNGDKVEWKLVSEEGNPVKEAYYNTIALQHEQKPDGKIEYKFARVNYKNGDGTYEVVQDGIGDYPEDETKYPETSGFVISGLKSAVDIFQISKENFAKVMQQLNPTYVGINKQGTIKMEPKYFEDKYWVNSEGELFMKDQQTTLKADSKEQTKKEILLTEFLDNVTFYTHDPVLANYQGGFKFSGNDVNNNNHLTNGDKVWATFNMLNESDENIIINGNEIISSVTMELADVSGLKEVIDPMSPLWYVLMTVAGVLTLGTATLIAFLMTKHKKLKGK